MPLGRQACRRGVGGVGRQAVGRVERGRAGECRVGCASLGLLEVSIAARAARAREPQGSIPSKLGVDGVVWRVPVPESASGPAPRCACVLVLHITFI